MIGEVLVVSKYSRYGQKRPDRSLPSDWPEIQERTLERFHRTCQGDAYGCLLVATDVHHIVARVDGGGHNDENLTALCSVCHDAETVKLIRRLADERAEAKRQKKKKNHPGRLDRYE